ncbi:MAG: TolC family protein [Spirochaetes bacterium]|nr:TolC family protein [Spirochaetota bacterium]
MSAFAQSAGGLPADPFASEYEAAVAAYGEAIDFSAPLEPTQALSRLTTARAGGSPEAPYSLEDLLALAASGNPGLRAAMESEAAAEADFVGAKARRLPTLKAETSGSYIGNPLGPITLTAGQLGDFQGVAVPPRDVIIYKGMESTQYNFKLIGEVPLYTWGKIALGVDLARAGLGAASLQRSKAERELAVKLRASWDALCYLGRAGGILDLQARIGARLVDIAEKSAAAGFLTPADLASARIKLKEIGIAAVKLDEKRDRLVSELASMAGLRALSSGELLLGVPAAGAPRWAEPEAQALAMEGSYDLALVSAMLDAKRGLRDLAEKEAKGLPDIGLRVELSYGGPRFPFLETDWYGQDDYQLTFSLGTSGNIFGNAVKSGEAAKARAQLAEAEAQKADAERSIRAYVRETFLGIELGKARLEYAALRQDGWAADLAQMRATIQAGAGSESEYLSLMIEALGGLAEAYGTLAEYRSSVLSLEAVAGSMAAED